MHFSIKLSTFITINKKLNAANFQVKINVITFFLEKEYTIIQKMQTLKQTNILSFK